MLHKAITYNDRHQFCVLNLTRPYATDSVNISIQLFKSFKYYTLFIKREISPWHMH